MFSKKTKIITMMTLGFLIIACGIVFGLQKLGVVNIKGLADVLNPQSAGANHSLELRVYDLSTQNTPILIGKNQQIKIVSNEDNRIFFTSTTNSSSIVKYANIPSANYSIYATDCDDALATQVVPPESLTPPQAGGTINIYIQKQCGVGNGATGACGGQTCATNQHCNALGYCINNCTSTSCPTGQTCNTTTKECQASTTTDPTNPIPNNQFNITGKVYITDTNSPISGADATLDKNMKTAGKSAEDGVFTITATIPANSTSVNPSSMVLFIKADGHVPYSKNLALIKNQSTQDTTAITGGSNYDVGNVYLVKVAAEEKELIVYGKITNHESIANDLTVSIKDSNNNSIAEAKSLSEESKYEPVEQNQDSVLSSYYGSGNYIFAPIKYTEHQTLIISLELGKQQIKKYVAYDHGSIVETGISYSEDIYAVNNIHFNKIVNKYFAQVNFNVLISKETAEKTFSVFGKISTFHTRLDGVNIFLYSPQADINYHTISHKNTTDKFGSLYPDYEIKDIPLIEGVEYYLGATELELEGNIYEPTFSNNLNGVTFTSSDLAAFTGSGKLFISIDFSMYFKHFASSTIKYFDAVTGNPIDLTQETNIKTHINCLAYDNSLIACNDKYNILNEGDKNSITYSFLFNVSISPTAEVEYLSDKYILANGGQVLVLEESSSLYLIPKNNKNESIKCQVYAETKFCTYAFQAQNVFSDDNAKYFENYGLIISTLSPHLNVNWKEDLTIFIMGPSEIRAFMSTYPDLLGEIKSKYLFSLPIKEIRDEHEGIDTLVHEFGHIVDFSNIAFKNLEGEFLGAINVARGKNPDGTTILDDNRQPVKSCNNIFKNYRCFSDHAITTNHRELWAEFFTFWVLGKDGNDIGTILQDEQLKKPENYHCYRALMFLDWVMESHFPKMKLFRTSQDVLNNLNTNVLGETTDINQKYLNIMSDVGYEEVQKRTYNTISPIQNLSLTPSQIASGVWLKENYDELPLTQKISFQFSIQFNKAKNVISSVASLSVTAMRNAVNAINKEATKILASLGIYVKHNSISGTISDKDGPLPGMMVSFGGKSNISGNTGKYVVTYVMSGTHKLVISNPRIDKTYNVGPKTLTIGKEEVKDNVDVLFTTVPKRRITGQVIFKNKPLANGKIIANDGFKSITITLNSQGKFSYWLKENQYSFKIKHSNNTTRFVTNPGAFGNVSIWGNITKLKIVNNSIDSMIWVK